MKLSIKYTNSQIINGIGAFVSLAGLIVLLGWYLDKDLLKTFGLGSVEMKPASAVYFLLTGLILIFLQKNKLWAYSLLARIFSVAIIILTGFVIFQFYFRENINPLRFYFNDVSLSTSEVYAEKISINSIFNFVLIGFVILGFSFKITKSNFLLLFFSVLVICISLIGFINYAFGLTELTGLPDYTKMAGNTSILFFILAIGILLIIYDDRKLLPSIENILLFGITLASVLIVFGSAISITSFKSLVYDYNKLEERIIDKQKMWGALSEVYKFTSDKKENLISNDQRYIEEQTQTKENINKILDNLIPLLYYSPLQQELMISLKEIAREQIAFSDSALILKDTTALEGGIERIKDFRAKQIDKINTIIPQLIAEESQNLEERKAFESEKAQNTLLIIVVSLSVQLMLLAFLFIFIRNDIKRRKRAKKELYRINSHLDKIVKERTLELQNTIHELEISKEKAEASDRLKTAFLNNISHEICTPLNGILGFAPLIIQPDCSIEEKEMYLDRLNNSSERLINTVTAFMDISMIVSNNLEVSFKEMEISPLILEIYNQYKKACQKKSIDLIMELPENEQDYIFKTDENLLRKTLSHLMDNAIKFTHIGSIIIGAKFKGKTLELFVKDTGQGIAKEEQKRVFDFFMQENIDNTRGHEGSGLGLSILKGIIKLLSGNLNLVSEKDKGTAIYITLPIETDKTIPKA